MKIVDTIKEYITPKEYHMKYINPQPTEESILVKDFVKGVKAYFSQSGLEKNGRVLAKDLNQEEFDVDTEQPDEDED